MSGINVIVSLIRFFPRISINAGVNHLSLLEVLTIKSIRAMHSFSDRMYRKMKTSLYGNI